MRVETIPISEIALNGKRRALGDISALVDSIRQVGLLNPITVSKDLHLIAGLHRVEACKALGWSEIPALIISLNDIDSQLAEIDENLIRNELTRLERSEQLERRKALYEAKYPQAKQGGDRGNQHTGGKARNPQSATPSFVKDTAAKTKRSPRSIQEDVQIAKNIPETIRNTIRDTPVADRKEDLLTLSRMPKTTQKKVADKIAKGKAKTVKEAARQVYKENPDEQPDPKKAAQNSPAVKWADLVHNLWMQLNSIRDAGGIGCLAKKWSIKNKQLYLKEVQDLQAGLSKIEKDLKEIIKNEHT